MKTYLAGCCLFLALILADFATAQPSVNTHEGVPIGGRKQWIGARSDDATKPLLLFLHGGPGFSSRAYGKKFVKQLRKNFIVAQWDQPGAGITAAWGTTADSLTLDRLHRDTEEVIQYLLTKFGKERLYLVGFSWGGFLGLHYAKAYPERLHAYVSVSGMIHNWGSERLTLELLREKAAAADDPLAREEIDRIHIPFESWEELYFQRKWTARLLGDGASRRAYPEALFRNWSEQWFALFLAASAVDYREVAPTLDCPVYFFQSRRDYVANYRIAVDYFERLVAERKEIIWFEESTHEIPSDEPRKFSTELIRISSGTPRPLPQSRQIP